MHRVSSNWTIFFKIFIPTIWITFFGLMTLAILISDEVNLPFGNSKMFKFGFLLFFIVFFTLMYFSIMRLKRVDFDHDGVYVSNYFKIYRYPYIDIESIQESSFGFLTIGTITLKQKGSLGKTFKFIISKIHFDAYIKEHPSYFSHLIEESKV